MGTRVRADLMQRPAPLYMMGTATALEIGDENRVKKRNAPQVDRDRILECALAIIDSEGLNGFSLSKVAASIGITAPSLYYYYTNKTEILHGVSNHIFSRVVRSIPRRRGDWRDVLISICVDARRTMLKHPKAAPLLLLYPPRHVLLEGYERGFRLMEKARVPPEQRLQISLGLENLTWGATLLAAGALSRGQSSFPPYDPGQYPALAAAREACRKTDEELFVADCRAYLAGVELQG